MTSRRSVLAALGTVGGATLAGCSGLGNVLGDDDETTATADHRQWLVRPEVFDVETYVFSAIAPTPLLERSDQFDERAVPEEPTVPVIGVDDHEQVDEYVLFGTHGAAAVGSFEPDPVGTALEERGYQSTDPIRGVDGYEGADGRVGVVGDGLVVLTGGDSGRDRIGAILAARDGEHARYHETNDDVGAAVDAIDDGQLVSVVGSAGVPPDLDGARALGYSARLGDGDLTAAMAVAFPDGDADPDPVEAWANESAMFYGEDVTVSEVGRAVRVDVTVDLSDVTGFPVTTHLFPLPAPVEPTTATESA
jgi:hypothetical protein